MPKAMMVAFDAYTHALEVVEVNLLMVLQHSLAASWTNNKLRLQLIKVKAEQRTGQINAADTLLVLLSSVAQIETSQLEIIIVISSCCCLVQQLKIVYLVVTLVQ